VNYFQLVSGRKKVTTVPPAGGGLSGKKVGRCCNQENKQASQVI